MTLLPPQDPEQAFKHALRLVNREVQLREAARVLELVPARWSDAERLFLLADEVRRERLRVLAEAGVL